MPFEKSIQVSKLEAAQRQLETAIKLFFGENNDPISIHTLASAAYNIIRDIKNNKFSNTIPMLAKEFFLLCIKPGHEEDVRKKIQFVENFFKHADKDPDGICIFNPKLSEFFIFDACSTYSRITNTDPSYFRIFRWWYIIHNENLFKFPEKEEKMMLACRQDIINLTRKEFMDWFLMLEQLSPNYMALT